MEAAHLGGRLAHDNAGHKRHAGHVSAGPKLIFRYVLVADADTLFEVVVHNRRELLHFEALGIVAADFIDVRDDLVEIELGEIDDQILIWHGTLAEAFARIRFSPHVGDFYVAGCRRDGGRDWPSSLFDRALPWNAPSIAEISHAEARRPRRRDSTVCNQLSVSAWRTCWKRGLGCGQPEALLFRGKIPGSEPGNRCWLQVEIGPESFVHVAQMAGAVEDSDVLFARGHLRFKHREGLLVSLGNDGRTFFTAEANHQAFHFR